MLQPVGMPPSVVEKIDSEIPVVGLTSSDFTVLRPSDIPQLNGSTGADAFSFVGVVNQIERWSVEANAVGGVLGPPGLGVGTVTSYRFGAQTLKFGPTYEYVNWALAVAAVKLVAIAKAREATPH